LQFILTVEQVADDFTLEFGIVGELLAVVEVADVDHGSAPF